MTNQWLSDLNVVTIIKGIFLRLKLFLYLFLFFIWLCNLGLINRRLQYGDEYVYLPKFKVFFVIWIAQTICVAYNFWFGGP